MPQENGQHSTRHSSRSSHSRGNVNRTDNGTDKTRSNHEIKERGYYSELATINPESTFEVNMTQFCFFEIIFFIFRLLDKHQLLMMMFYEKHFVCRIQLEVFSIDLMKMNFEILCLYFSKYF